MTLEYIAVLALIAVLSVVQSYFGMGILVFGTPTLLLAGCDFIPTLGYLLPASCAISLLQVVTGYSKRPPISRDLYLLCLPGIGIGLWLVYDSPLASWTNMLVGGTLLVSALTRSWGPSRQLMTNLLEKHQPTFHLMMGLVHGMTNLGGALLAILASGTNTEKEAIRYTVAHYYLAFSIVQMLMLTTVMGHHGLLFGNLPGAVVSSLVFLLFGNFIFNRTSNRSYNTALTIFIAIYGIAVLLKSLPISPV